MSYAQDQQKVDSLMQLLSTAVADTSLMKLNIKLARAYAFNDPDSSNQYLNKGFSHAQRLSDTSSIAQCLNLYGILALLEGKNLTALELFNESFTNYKSVGENDGASAVINNIGIIYGYLKDHENAIEYYKQSYEMSMQSEDWFGSSLNLYNIASDYIILNQPDNAEKYLQKLVDHEFKYGEATNYDDLKAELFKYHKQLDSAEVYCKKAIQFSKDDQDVALLCALYVQLGEIFLEMKDYRQSLNYLDLADSISIKNDYIDVTLDSYEARAKVYDSTGDFRQAFSYQSKYLDLKNEMDSTNNFNRISELSAKYGTEKGEKELAEMEAQMAATNAERKASDRVYLITGLAVLIVLIVMFVSIIRKKRINRLLNLQNSQIRLQRQKIISSINYAQKIQQSILIPENDIQKHLPNSFVFFQPKDIVSGDFYWFAEIDNKIILSTVDCTGHGVPGAFMSLIASSKLNKVVNEMGIYEPSQILEAVHKEIVVSLNQSSYSENAQDGMDMSICVIDKANKMVQFAGAQNPIVVIRNGEFEEIKADNLSIGGTILQSKLNGTFKFSTKDVSIDDNTYLFMFTDGYVDQFGGEENKKLNKSNFKDIMQEICAQNFRNAKAHLEHQFNTWRGDNPQLDDVLIIGAKLS
jgi:serine phosphatase RsbU (regulator of sigma subunit)